MTLLIRTLDQYPITEAELSQVDVSLLKVTLSLSPAQRLARLEHMRRFVVTLRQAGEKHYGFNPSALVEAAYQSS